MSDHSQTLARDIEADPDRVWAVLTDLDHAEQNLSGVERIERLTEGPYRVGTRWRETRTMLGKESTQEMEVTDLEALGSTTVASSAGGVRYTTTFRLEALHPGTRLTMEFAGDAHEAGALTKIAAKVMGPLGNKAARQAMEKDLDDIVAAAERAAHPDRS